MLFMHLFGHKQNVVVSEGIEASGDTVIKVPQSWFGRRVVAVPEDDLVLLAHNRHIPSCGTPPGFKIDSGDRVSYFENEHGEQWVLIFRAKTGETHLRGGDIAWDEDIRVVSYRGEITTPQHTLNERELAWLKLAIETAGIKLKSWRPTPSQRAAWEAARALRYYSLNPQAAGVPAIRVFISSASDLAKERKLVAEAVLNVGKRLNIPTMPMLWEGAALAGHYVPPFPAKLTGEGAQAVIDNHLFQSLGGYDIYVGMAWARMGTATGAFQSGTEAELRAAQRWQKQNGRPSSILFFRKVAPTPQRLADENQMTRLAHFVEEIRAEGLMHDFRTSRQLTELIEGQLAGEIVRMTRTDGFWRKIQERMRRDN